MTSYQIGDTVSFKYRAQRRTGILRRIYVGPDARRMVEVEVSGRDLTGRRVKYALHLPLQQFEEATK